MLYLTSAEVRDVDAALRDVDMQWLRRRFDGIDGIDDDSYEGTRDDEDFEYTWDNFTDLRAFYQKPAEAGRAIIFTAT